MLGDILMDMDHWTTRQKIKMYYFYFIKLILVLDKCKLITMDQNTIKFACQSAPEHPIFLLIF